MLPEQGWPEQCQFLCIHYMKAEGDEREGMLKQKIYGKASLSK